MKHRIYLLAITYFLAVGLHGFDDTKFIDIDCSSGYDRVGCFKRLRNDVTDLILTDRDFTSDRFSGVPIDWDNFDSYLDGLLCRCYHKALRHDYKVFSIGFYGECWAGRMNKCQHLVANGKLHSDKCVNGSMKICQKTDKKCTGIENTDFLYVIK